MRVADGVEISELSTEAAEARLADLVALLQDSVESGASIGFLPPVETDEAREYWRSVFGAMRSGSRVLLVAHSDGVLAGSVQLGYETRRNGDHRAEVMKLMVHTGARRRGIGWKLMHAAESTARAASRSLLVLDTRRGDPSELLYRKLGYETAGVIPGYARSATGMLHDTIIMYRTLI